MNARRVHAVLAYGVRNPHRIAQWTNDPAPLRAEGIEPRTLDLAALLRLAGLTVKVRHNGVRSLLPMSFRFMAAAGIELDLFSDYAKLCSAQSQSLPNSNEERANALFCFVESWLQPDNANHQVLWDLIRHETALAQLSRDAVDSSMASFGESEAPCLSSSIPKRNGLMILHEYQSDPRQLIATLDRRQGWNGVAKGLHYFGYWRAAGSTEAQIVELDDFSFHALRYADGANSVAAISRLLTGKPRPSRSFLALMSDLASLGLLRFCLRHRRRQG